ncbi:hypothetical protein AVEN_3887-1 [Araneus ventricosus]|uniref:DDE-1 domain-containing protein n=1 Tax=Araneus ventricosus TaxID=182803 RepID=A0A4Y2R9N6_ARAVE|nr:hypothetical protein AVEN_3887-1 [Araneus ventricosus]
MRGCRICKLTLANPLVIYLPRYISKYSRALKVPIAKFKSRSVWAESVFEECNQENSQDWLECNDDEPDNQVLADDEIIASVIKVQDTCDDEEEPSGNDRAERNHPLRRLLTALRWI